MKAIPSTLLTAVIASLWCFLVLNGNAWARTSPDEPAAQTAQPQKRSLFSWFRRQEPPQAQQQQQAQQPQQAYQQQQAQQQQARQQQQRVHQQRVQRQMQQVQQQQPPAEPEKRGFLRFPKLNMPDVKMPKLRLPAVKLPFRGQKVSRQTVQNYPTGVPNPKLGGAYGVILEDQVKFYEIGPTQPFGPDEILSEGALVTIRSNDHAWAYITLRDGRSGYIGLDQVRMAAPREVRVSPPSRQGRHPLVAQHTDPSETYDPPALPTEAAIFPDEPESNPLFDDSPEAAVADDEWSRPVDSPEVLFDPFLDPLDPVMPASSGGREPFLDDPIPSVEEELRAIQEAKEAAEGAGSESEEPGDEDSESKEPDDEDSSSDDEA